MMTITRGLGCSISCVVSFDFRSMYHAFPSQILREIESITNNNGRPCLRSLTKQQENRRDAPPKLGSSTFPQEYEHQDHPQSSKLYPSQASADR